MRAGAESAGTSPAPLRVGAGEANKVPPPSYSPTKKPGSTIADAGLNFRVRNGNGCGPRSMGGGINRKDQNGLCNRMGFWAQVKQRRLMPSSEGNGKPLPKKEGGQASRAISTGQLHVLPRFHLRPINVLVSDGPSGERIPGRPCLEAGFPLRCFQRLSLPNMATRRCSWRNNRYTRGSSIPVLSY
jgi:hypothetical protein